MVKTVLYDGLNISLKKGTGVATYVRSLIKTAQSLGHKTGVVHAIQGAPPKTPLLREVVLFDDTSVQPLGPVATGRRWLRRRIAAPFGIKPVRIPLSGTVITMSQETNLGDADIFYADNDIFQLARSHFKLYGNRLQLDIKDKPDLWHCTYPMPLSVRDTLNIYTIHDLVPLRLPYLTEDNKRYHYNMLRHLVKTADHIVTVSESSRRDIINILKVDEKRVTNTYQAAHVPLKLRNKPDDVVADEISGIFNLDWKKYFLFFGAFEPKKNLFRLVEAYLAAKVDLPLIIVGAPGWKGDKAQQLVDDERFRFYMHAEDRIVPGRRIHRFDFVSYPLLVSLIRGARSVLFPSLYEGFGLPILESMQLGTPVLTSTEGSVPEVAGEAALMIDPYDTDALRKAIKALASDDDLCDHLSKVGPKQAERFSPERYQQAIGALYDNLLDGR
ncbi:glycosyltransferase family 4 protein [Phyllobacterium myrsinacearum]|uniref:Glycosyltransferase involved in cell wall biosynthesis n=1 Tax=Phyllobacterium myrsinacearum TaxID=28101 RepID=A0A839EMD6_9HYPH|nr:glycosyltransferase family 1 protein [Phyllobacterium myrsinacearum]MBA8879375.1 glycosyltransferase involved in cell wall biosynthesis [Phyllobacterium myrsinacearum]